MPSESQKTVCLINPPLFYRSDTATTIHASPPLGLAYLAAHLEKEYNVVVVDGHGEKLDSLTPFASEEGLFLCGLTLEEIIGQIPKDPLVIGISCMFTSVWGLHKLLINKIRKLHPKVPIILGGENITAIYQNALIELNDPNIYCVLGEGEVTLKELCDFFRSSKLAQKSVESIDGIAYLDFKGEVTSSRRRRIKNLDELNWPAWKYFPMESYISRGISYLNKRTIPMLTSRGCPYRCKFCSAPNTWGAETYLRSPEDIVDEIQYYVKIYNVEHIEFMDLVGVVSKKWTLKLCQLLIERRPGVTISFAPGTRSEILDYETLLALKQAKIIRILYAPDSGSSEEAKKIKKFVNFKKLTKSLRTCIKLGIPSRVVTIIGFPGQTYRELLKSLSFSLKCVFLGANDVFINNFVPYSGSEFYDELKETRPEYQLQNFSSFSVGRVDSMSENIPSWVLSLTRTSMMSFFIGLQYLLRPWRIYQSIVRLSSGKPITLTENYIYLKMTYKTNFNFINKKIAYDI